MAKKAKFNYKQFFIVGVVWSAFFIGVFIRILGVLLKSAIPERAIAFFQNGFNFLSLKSYLKYFEFFKSGHIGIESFDSFLLFFFIIFWIPIWLISWWFLNKVNWGKFKPKPKKSTITKKVFELKENKPLYQMPRKMPSVVQATRYIAPKLPSQAETVASGAKSHTNLVQMIRAIAGLAKKYQVEIFQHILLEGNRVPMAISTDARAVLLEIVNKKNVNWSVEFTDDVTAGGWYSESGVMERLAQDLMGASAALARSEPNSEILSAIVITDGRILNTKQAIDYFRSKGIFLIGFNNAEPKNELPDLASFLSAYFDLKPGEQDPAPHPVEKVPLRSKTTAPIESEVKPETVPENNEVSSDSSSNVDDDSIDSDIDDDIDVDEDDTSVINDLQEDDVEEFEFEDDDYNHYENSEDTSQFEGNSTELEEQQSDVEEAARLRAEEEARLITQRHAEEQAQYIAKLRAEAEARLQAKIEQQRATEQSHLQVQNQSVNAQHQTMGQVGHSTTKVRAPMPINKPTVE